MRYREHLPPALLTPWVRCFWTLQADPGPGIPTPAAPDRHLVVPDACLDLLFRLHERPKGPGAQVVGTMTRPLPVVNPPSVDLLGVRFHPGAARPFLPCPANHLTDDGLELELAWPDGALLRERLTLLPSTGARIRVLSGELLARLGPWEESTGARADAQVREALRLLHRPAPPATAEVARRVGLGRRQLGRRFREAVGIPPSVAHRVLRFQDGLHLLWTRPDLSLSRVALTAGYHDQPHFTREFQALAAEAPGRYRRRRGLVGAVPRDHSPDGPLGRPVAMIGRDDPSVQDAGPAGV